MSSPDHNFDFGGDVAAPRTADVPQTGAFERMSLNRKLKLAVFGNTIVLALVAIVMLGGTWQLGQGGHAQAVIASIEVRSNNAAIALVDAEKSLEAAQSASNASSREQALSQAVAALDLAHETLTDPIEFAGDRMPADIGPVVEGFRTSVDNLRADVQEAAAGSSDIPALLVETQTLYDELSTFALDFHDEAASSADRLFASITQFLVTFLAITAAGIAISLIGAGKVIRDVTGMIGSITGAMERIAAGKVDTEIPGGERQDEIGAMARALAVFQASSLKLRNLTDNRARDAEEQLAQQQLGQPANARSADGEKPTARRVG